MFGAAVFNAGYIRNVDINFRYYAPYRTGGFIFDAIAISIGIIVSAQPIVINSLVRVNSFIGKSRDIFIRAIINLDR